MWQCFEGTDLRPLERVWQAANAVAPASVFQSFAFARRWAEAFGEGTRLRIWVHSPEPLIVPVALWDDRLTLLGEGLFDYQGLIGAGCDRLQREAGQLATEEDWRELCVTGVRAECGQEAFWRTLAAVAAPFAAAPLRAASGGVAGLEREHPRTTRRWRRAVREGCVLRLETDPTARMDLFEWLLAQKAHRCAEQGKRNVLGETEQRWLRLMVEGEPRMSELWSWRDGGGILSGLLCWRTDRVRYAYTIAHGPRGEERSPGILLLFALLRRTMEEERSFDFLTGEQAFKHRFANDRRKLLRYCGRRTEVRPTWNECVPQAA